MANADRIIELLHEAKARPAGAEREQFLAKACRDDVALREQIVSLLKADADEGDSDFLRIARTLRPPALPSEKPGDRIGRYKLLEQIGEGGCGVVYMAEQEEPVRRRVALKVIKLGMDTKQVIARFEAERQALAMMDYPNIAKVLDGGATDTGRPFFVMELVRGIKITDYCDQNNLPTNERLELFMQVCQAIQHAHQKGIIHRDIKPSNILVTLHDDVAVPKVIDFGIAKATVGQLTDKTVFTAFAQFIGTPAYMSPEQAQMSGLDVDTRADIYSLGVLLYELLTGNTPFDAKELLAAGMDEMRRKIREDEPAKPSTCLSTMQAMDLTTVARRRHVEPPKLIHLIRGDLDWLVMKCLEKDRTRRYETANGLAMDIQRHLDNEPVIARPPTNLYRFQKLVRRNKLAFAAASAVVAALVLGLGISTWMFFKAEGEKQKAQTEAAKATAISDFLQQLLRSANPDALKGSDYTVRQLLDDFSAGLANQLENQPEVEAAVRATIGRAYYRLGSADKAQAQHERALTVRRRIFGNRSELVAESLVDYGWSCFEQGQYAKGEPFVREALEIYRKRGTAGQPVIYGLWALQKLVAAQEQFAEMDSVTAEALTIAGKSPSVEFPEMASMIHGLAETKNKQAKYDEGASLARRAFEMHRRLRGAEHPETAWALVSEGIALRGQQKLTEAEAALREALRIFRKYYSSGHKSVDQAMAELKSVLEARGDSAAVEALYREVLAGQRTALGNDSPAVAETLSSLAASLYAQGKLAEAEKASREAVEIILKLRDQDLAKLLPVVRRLAEVLKSQGKSPDAQKLYEQTIQAARQSLGESDPALGELLHEYGEFLGHENKFEAAAEYHFKALAIRRAQQDDHLAWTLRSLGGDLVLIGRPQEAELYLRESLTLYRKLHQQEDIYGTAWTTERLGFALHQQHKLPEAEQLYRDALRACAECQAVGSELYAVVVRSLLNVLKAQNKLVEGEALCRELLAQQRAAFTNDNPAVAQILSSLADNLLSQGKPAEAEPLLREAIALHEKAVASFPNNAELRSQLVELFRGQGKLADAEPVLRKALARQRELVGSEHLDVATSLFSLSFLLRQEGKLPEAETTAREALAIRKKLLGNENSDVAHSLHLLAWNLNMQGKCAEAEAFSREELAMRRKLLGIEHPDVAWTLADLTIFLRDQKKLPEAETTIRESLAIRRKAFGDEHPDVAASFNLLCDLLRAQGKLAELETPYGEELAMRRKLLGSEHLDVAASLSSLSMLFREQGKLPEAETTAREALAIRKKLLGNEHADVAQSLHLLAYNINLQGKHTEAEALSREEVAMWRKLLGNEHPKVAWALSDLTIFLRDQKKLPEAETTIRESLAIRQMAFGNEHPDVAVSFKLLGELLRAQGKLAELASLLQEQLGAKTSTTESAQLQFGHLLWQLGDGFLQSGQFKEAERVYDQSLQKFKQLQTQFPMNVFYRQEQAFSLRKLADVMQRTGRLAEAGASLRTAWDIYTQLAKEIPASPLYPREAAFTHRRLAEVLIAQGKPDEAEAMCRDDLATKKKLFGNVSREVDEALGSLARVLRQEGKLAEAEAVQRDELAMERKLSGNEHPFVANSLQGLAVVLRDSGKSREAEALFREALDMRRKLLGNDDPAVATSLSWLGAILSDQGKNAEAEAVYREALQIRRKLPAGEQSGVDSSLNSLGYVLRLQDKHAEAETVYRELLASRRKLPADDPRLTVVLAELTRTLLAGQKFVEAEPPARECLALREKQIPDDWLTFNARSLLGGSLLGQKKYADAEPLLLSGYEGMKQREDKIPANSKRYVKETLQRLGQLYEASGQPVKAAEWNKKLAEFDRAEAEKKTGTPKL